MKSIFYSGGTVITGDTIADVVLEYASELARHESSDTVEVPIITEAGVIGHVKMLLGPASQFVVTELDHSAADPIDNALVAYVTEKTGLLRSPKPVASTDTTDYPDMDDLTSTAIDTDIDTDIDTIGSAPAGS